ncbi:MAG: histidine kinase [Cyclobacteriaceae bacterium]|nr:histidine kinase [Cyclobacteriaceae bacterium]
MSKQYSPSEFADILIYFSSSIMNKESEMEIAWDVAKNCISKLGFVDCVIYFFDEKEKVLRQAAAYGHKNPKEYEILEPITISLGVGITGHVAQTLVAEIIDDTSTDYRYVVDDKERLSEITVPIFHHKALYGIIDCEHPRRGFFNQQDLQILSAIASICAIRIRSLRAESEIQEQKAKLMEAQVNLLELEVKALRSQMNPYFVYNAIGAIQSFIASDQRQKALAYISTLGKLIHYHLQYFEKDQVPLQAEVNMLNSYLELQKMRYSDKFEYQFNHKLCDDDFNRHIPGKVLPSLIENAVEKSMFDSLAHASLCIYLVCENCHLKVEVYCSQELEPASDLCFNYHHQIIPWEEQVDLLNQFKKLDIERSITILNEGVDKKGEINISVSLPVF